MVCHVGEEEWYLNRKYPQSPQEESAGEAELTSEVLETGGFATSHA